MIRLKSLVSIIIRAEAQELFGELGTKTGRDLENKTYQTANTESQTVQETSEVEKKMEDKEVQVNLPNVTYTQKSLGVQVNLKEDREQDDQREEEEKRTRKVLDNMEETSLQAVADILDLTWPEGFYNKVIREEKGLGKVKTDMAILVDLQDAGEEEHTKTLANRHPEMVELLRNEVENGKIKYMANHTVFGYEGTEKEEERYVYFLPMNIDPNGASSME